MYINTIDYALKMAIDLHNLKCVQTRVSKVKGRDTPDAIRQFIFTDR
jgi:hypothetical protein